MSKLQVLKNEVEQTPYRITYVMHGSIHHMGTVCGPIETIRQALEIAVNGDDVTNETESWLILAVDEQHKKAIFLVKNFEDKLCAVYQDGVWFVRN